jgi:hypothetical protein
MLLAMRRGYVGISSGLATIETQARDWPLASFDFEAARDLLDRPRRRDAMDALADGSHKRRRLAGTLGDREPTSARIVAGWLKLAAEWGIDGKVFDTGLSDEWS